MIKSVYDEVCELADEAYWKFLEEPSTICGQANPAYIRYETQLAERTKFKLMLEKELGYGKRI